MSTWNGPDALRSLLVKIDSVMLDPANVRKHSEEQLEQIAASLRRFGQQRVIVVQEQSSIVLAGNATLQAARKLGWDSIAAVRTPLQGVEAVAFAIADNRTAELATWDVEELVRTMEQVGDIPGFNEDDVSAFMRMVEEANAAANPASGDSGAEELSKVVTSKRGDLWILGGPNGHRLLCGDSTNEDDVARLMDGAQPRMMATDPPYLVDYDGTNHPAEHHAKAGRKAPEAADSDLGNKHWDAYIDPESSVKFFDDFIRVALKHIHPDSAIYQWHASKRVALVEEAWKKNGLLVHQTIVWVKSRGVLTRSHFLWKSEPCLYGWIEGNQPSRDRRPPSDMTNVWEIGQAGENDGIHPTQKPREIFANPMRWHLREGEIAYEPFSGSGTSIIAAEETKRRCFAMELSPEFVDADVRRFIKSTGKTVTLDGTGQTFEEVVAARAS